MSGATHQWDGGKALEHRPSTPTANRGHGASIRGWREDHHIPRPKPHRTWSEFSNLCASKSVKLNGELPQDIGNRGRRKNWKCRKFAFLARSEGRGIQGNGSRARKFQRPFVAEGRSFVPALIHPGNSCGPRPRSYRLVVSARRFFRKLSAFVANRP